MVQIQENYHRGIVVVGDAGQKATALSVVAREGSAAAGGKARHEYSRKREWVPAVDPLQAAPVGDLPPLKGAIRGSSYQTPPSWD